MNLLQIQYSSALFLIMVALVLMVSSCEKELPVVDLPEPVDYGYVIYIDQPRVNSTYLAGDTLPISIRYVSETNEIIHNIAVEIHNERDPSVKLYSVESHQHIPDFFEYKDNFVLKDSSKIGEGIHWILKASLWSHEADADTVSTSLNISVQNL